MVLIWDIIKAIAISDSIDKKTKREKEMDKYGLEPWQKELVRKGQYEPWNFEESGEFEEDDYYYEDDEN